MQPSARVLRAPSPYALGGMWRRAARALRMAIVQPPPACCACLPRRHWGGCLDLRKPRMSLDVLALGDDAIAEGDIAGAALQFAHFEAIAALAPHIESLAVALRCEEHAIPVERHHLGEIRIDVCESCAVRRMQAAGGLSQKLQGR